MSALSAEPSPYQVCKPLTDREYANLRQSIQLHGCLVPIEVDEAGDVIDGHHRRAACEELGLSYERVLVAGLSREQKIARAVEVNNVRRAPEWATREERDARVIELRREGKSTTVIAEEIGVSADTVGRSLSTSASAEVETPDVVVGKDGKRHPATHPSKAPDAIAARREAVAAMRESGASVSEIADGVGISASAVYAILRKLGTPASDEPQPAKPSASVAEKYERVRGLAGEGWTSAQIADAVGMSVLGLRAGCKQRGIEVPADAVLWKTRSHDSDRIVRNTVEALEGLALGIRYAVVADLDADEINDWTASLTESLRALNRFNKKMKEAVQ